MDKFRPLDARLSMQYSRLVVQTDDAIHRAHIQKNGIRPELLPASGVTAGGNRKRTAVFGAVSDEIPNFSGRCWTGNASDPCRIETGMHVVDEHSFLHREGCAGSHQRSSGHALQKVSALHARAAWFTESRPARESKHPACGSCEGTDLSSFRNYSRARRTRRDRPAERPRCQQASLPTSPRTHRYLRFRAPAAFRAETRCSRRPSRNRTGRLTETPWSLFVALLQTAAR